MILTFDKQNWFFDMLRQFFMALDNVIYSLISWILQGIFELSNVAVNDAFVEIIYKRIYVVLGVFMVFKLTFSFLQYMINPDTLVDKDRGAGKLIVRVVVMLCLLVGMPILFFEDELIKIEHKDGSVEQTTILDALQKGVLNTLPRVILGSSNADDVRESSKENGEYLATEMFKAFYYPSVCDEGESKADACEKDGKKLTKLSSIATTATLENADTGYYTYHYIWPLTTVAGIVLVIILLGFAVDIAVRVFKLILLQVVAPVPIMSYIDPKSSKDGALNSWFKNFVSTYLELFIKLGTVYIVLLLCSKLFSKEQDALIEGGIALNGFNEKTFLFVFLTIGLFKFAKDAPKFIKDALGIKDTGGSMFGGLQTLGAAAGVLGGATAGLVGGAAGGIAAAKAAGQGNKMAALKGLGSGLSGLARGGVQGGKGAAKGNLLKGMSGAIAAQNAVTQRNLTNAANGSTFGGRLQTRAQQFFTGQTAADKDELAIKGYEDAISQADSFRNVLSSAAADSDMTLDGRNLKQFNSVLEAAKSGDKSAINMLKNYGFSKRVSTTKTDASGRKITTYAEVGDLTAAIAGAADYKKEFEKSYYEAAMNNPSLDKKSEGVLAAADAAATSMELAGITEVGGESFSAKSAGAFIAEATSKKTAFAQKGSKYRVHKADADAIKRGN